MCVHMDVHVERTKLFRTVQLITQKANKRQNTGERYVVNRIVMNNMRTFAFFSQTLT